VKTVSDKVVRYSLA